MLHRRWIGALAFSVIGALSLSTFLAASQAPSPVADAAMLNDAETVRTLLKDGADVNDAQGDGMTALHWAAMKGNPELVDMLLYAGANVKATTRLGSYTPLHMAAKIGNGRVIQALLKAGAQVDEPTATGATPLMLAAASGDVPAVQALLDAGADVNAKESANDETPLMFASAFDRVDAAKLLIGKGAKLDETSKVIDLRALTDPLEEQFRQQFQQQQQQGQGGQAAAAGRGGNARGGQGGNAPQKKDIAGLTRPYRYNELVSKQGGLTPLLFAVRQGNTETVHALVDAGADVNHVSPGDQTSPLLMATINGHFDLAKYLLEHGANPNLASEAGVTPLYGAINVQWAPKALYPQPRAYLQQKLDYLGLMELLLQKGADPNARVNRKVWYSGYNFDLSGVDESGATPFWRAAYGEDVAAMKLLVKYGADPNIPTVKPAGRPRTGDAQRDVKDVSGLPPVPVGGPGVPPLLAAAGVGYGEGFAANSHRFAPGGWMPAVKYLVEELGANVNATDHEGNTAVHHAASRGDNEMIEYLVSKGADVTKVNREGQTTVDMANGPVQRTQPYPETIALLEKLGAKNNHKCVSC
ncbi:MAG: ankyrin repeat domain-containing protein [Vicinamibacterales bacterium]